MSINKFNNFGYKDITAYQAIKNAANPSRQVRNKQSRQQGKAFEKLIDISCECFAEQGMALIEKTPEPMRVIKPISRTAGQYLCCFEKSAQPDYKGVLNSFTNSGRSIVFEAKHTSGTRIDQNRVTKDQTDQLQKYFDMGAEVFVLVSFRMENFYKVPWCVWTMMKNMFGHKYATENELERWEIQFENGVLKFIEST